MGDKTIAGSDVIGKCLPSESLTTSYTKVRIIAGGAARRKILINAPAAMWISSDASGTDKYPIPANVDFQLEVNQTREFAFWLAAQSGTTTAYFIVSDA
jgi:hypothetical protein